MLNTQNLSNMDPAQIAVKRDTFLDDYKHSDAIANE